MARRGRAEDELNEEQARALELVAAGRNVFLTGDPGTGKSHALRHICAALVDKHGHAAVLKVAPTGAAALLIGGQTIQAYPGPGVPHGNVAVFKKLTPKQIRHVRAIVVDEVSMLDAEYFDHYFEAFPPTVQWVLCGDFYQLAPVGKAAHALESSISLAHYLNEARTSVGRFESEASLVRHAETLDPAVDEPDAWQPAETATPFGLQECTGRFAFQSIAWRLLRLTPVVLVRPYRTSDPLLLEAQRAIRAGDASSPVVQALLDATDRTLEGDIRPTKVLPLRTAVLAANQKELETLDSATIHVYEAEDSISAFTNKEWIKEQLHKDYFFTRECQADRKLELRVGAQVMMLVNESKDQPLALVNGSRGVVERFSYDLPGVTGQVTDAMLADALPPDWYAEVEADGDVYYYNAATGATSREPPADAGTARYPVVRFANGARRLVRPTAFEKRVVGKGTCVRKQLPLALAWAITVHKSQGASLELAHIDLEGTFGEGQAYVAISRARTVEGLEIRHYSPEAVRTSPLVREFYEAIAKGRHDHFVHTADLWWGAAIRRAGGKWRALFDRLPRFRRWAALASAPPPRPTAPPPPPKAVAESKKARR